MIINIKECKKAGFDEEQIKKIKSIARRLSKAAKEAQELNIIVFGGTGSGDLRFNDNTESLQSQYLILANLMSGSWDGGDGSYIEDDEGFLRGE